MILEPNPEDHGDAPPGRLYQGFLEFVETFVGGALVHLSRVISGKSLTLVMARMAASNQM